MFNWDKGDEQDVNNSKTFKLLLAADERRFTQIEIRATQSL